MWKLWKFSHFCEGSSLQRLHLAPAAGSRDAGLDTKAGLPPLLASSFGSLVHHRTGARRTARERLVVVPSTVVCMSETNFSEKKSSPPQHGRRVPKEGRSRAIGTWRTRWWPLFQPRGLSIGRIWPCKSLARPLTAPPPRPGRDCPRGWACLSHPQGPKPGNKAVLGPGVVDLWFRCHMHRTVPPQRRSGSA